MKSRFVDQQKQGLDYIRQSAGRPFTKIKIRVIRAQIRDIRVDLARHRST
ncbi:hypothetical protein JHL17_34480 [Azospirillum sp. YIM B02556]|uniref:Uncharacterized protein n=1 Tax=Azospirillum endophyticum TaxID=2800326 RepID=A0ABS1FGF3_9PROT|nr:hypothetical protein [Azospirillum endophyticum]MBK1842512.1 hypothetical protein [Azospirillum endophyticum]